MLYDVHGARLEIHATGASLRGAVALLLSQFQVSGGGRAAASLRLESLAPAQFPAEPELETSLARGDEAGGVAWPWAVFRQAERTVVVWPGRAHLSLDRDRRDVVLQACDAPSLTPEQRASVVFFAVTELLRPRGLFAIHAAAVECHGRAVLILGPPGAGKTTAMLSLLQAGWRLLSDDHPLLRAGADGGAEVLPFAAPVRLTADTITRFAERLGLTDVATPPAHAKASLPVETVAPRGVASAARPIALLLPEIVDWPRTRLTPLRRGQALEEVLRLTLGLATAEPAVATRHFSLLGSLIRETPCYRLMSGMRVEDDLPLAVDATLEKAAA